MPIRDRIIWGRTNPFSDPRLAGLERFVRGIRQGRLPRHVSGGSIFANLSRDLPPKPHGYYREYDVEPSGRSRDRSKLRLVLGNGGEVYITGNHYDDFRQIVDLPS
jgi:guanyl-specific ribonuclease Sa